MVRGAVVHDDRELLVELEINPGQANRARLNRSPCPRPRDVLGVLRTVLFAPEDLALVRGDPAERRRFLDELLVAARAAATPGCAPTTTGCSSSATPCCKTRLARRRRGAGGDLSTLDVWDAHLARHGAELLPAGCELVADARPARGHGVRRRWPAARGRGRRWPTRRRSARRGRCPAPTPSATLPAAAELPAALLARVPSGAARGRARASRWSARTATTSSSPSAGCPAKGYASHGESWSYALALRLAAYELLRADGDRAGAGARRRVRRARRRPPGRAGRGRPAAEQVLVTAAVADDVPAELRGARYEVGDGIAVLVKEAVPAGEGSGS